MGLRYVAHKIFVIALWYNISQDDASSTTHTTSLESARWYLHRMWSNSDTITLDTAVRAKHALRRISHAGKVMATRLETPHLSLRRKINTSHDIESLHLFVKILVCQLRSTDRTHIQAGQCETMYNSSWKLRTIYYKVYAHLVQCDIYIGATIAGQICSMSTVGRCCAMSCTMIEPPFGNPLATST